jgi:hypothetical protein
MACTLLQVLRVQRLLDAIAADVEHPDLLMHAQCRRGPGAQLTGAPYRTPSY